MINYQNLSPSPPYLGFNNILLPSNTLLPRIAFLVLQGSQHCSQIHNCYLGIVFLFYLLLPGQFSDMQNGSCNIVLYLKTDLILMWFVFRHHDVNECGIKTQQWNMRVVNLPFILKSFRTCFALTRWGCDVTARVRIQARLINKICQPHSQEPFKSRNLEKSHQRSSNRLRSNHRISAL